MTTGALFVVTSDQAADLINVCRGLGMLLAQSMIWAQAACILLLCVIFLLALKRQF